MKNNNTKTTAIDNSAKNQTETPEPQFSEGIAYANLRLAWDRIEDKTFVMRINIHIPEELGPEKISTFAQRFVEIEKNEGYDPSYIVARDGNSDGNRHFHMGLLLDGNKTSETSQHIENAKKVLQDVIGPEYSAEERVAPCNQGIIVDSDLGKSDMPGLKAIQGELSPLAMEDSNANKEFFHTRFISIPETLGGETFYETKVFR